MNRNAQVLIRLGSVFAVSVLGFVLLEQRARSLETRAAAAVAGLIGPSRITTIGKTSILVIPHHGPAFRAIVSPSCSATASVMSLVCLGALSIGGSRLRRGAAFGIAVATVLIGNIMRIGLSVIVGTYFGRGSLVLFHDWVGSVFSFVYTLGGFVIMLYLVLPNADRSPERETLVPA